MHFAGGDLWGVTGRQRIPTQPLEPLTRQQSRDCSVFLVAPPVLAPSSQAAPSRPAPRPDGTLLQPSLPLIVPCSLLLQIDPRTWLCDLLPKNPTTDLEATLFLQTTIEHFKVGVAPQVNFGNTQKQQLPVSSDLDGSDGQQSERFPRWHALL